MGIVLRRLLLSIVGPRGDVDWTLPWHDVLHHWSHVVLQFPMSLWDRSFFSDPPSPWSPFAVPTLYRFVWVPLPSWPPCRPPCGMCSGRTWTSERRPRLKGQKHASAEKAEQKWPQIPDSLMPTSRLWLETTTVAYRGNSQRVTWVGGTEVATWYHHWRVTGRGLCRSNLAGRPKNRNNGETIYPEFPHNRSCRMVGNNNKNLNDDSWESCLMQQFPARS